MASQKFQRVRLWSYTEDGDLLMNVMHHKLSVSHLVVSQVLSCCADNNWMLNYGDIAYVGDDLRPSMV